MRRLLWSAGAIGIVLATGACAGPDAPSAVQEPAAVTVNIAAMTPSAKRTAIATGFPAEVPVPAGAVTRGEAQGDAWDYEIEVAAAPAAVVRWYRQAYMGRQWLLVREGEFDGMDGGGTFLDFRKNNAESSVSVYGNGSPEATRVRVTVGVGTSVLQTQ